MIELKNITREFGGGDTLVRALKGISLDIKYGEMLAVVGVSGSGKTTLLNILGLLDNGFGGEYLLNGQDVKRLTSAQRARLRNEALGFVLQDFALIEEYTVRENVRLPLRYSRKDVHNAEQRIQQVCGRLGIAEKLNTRVSRLSGGQRQRAAIARALVNDPQIILADEPTGALDSKTADEISALLSELNRSGKTIIIVTHDMRLAEKCGKIVRISDGLIQQER